MKILTLKSKSEDQLFLWKSNFQVSSLTLIAECSDSNLIYQNPPLREITDYLKRLKLKVEFSRNYNISDDLNLSEFIHQGSYLNYKYILTVLIYLTSGASKFNIVICEMYSNDKEWDNVNFVY